MLVALKFNFNGGQFYKNIEILVNLLSCKFGLKLVLQIILLWAPRKKISKQNGYKPSGAYEKKIKFQRKFKLAKSIKELRWG